jgi:acyl-CoA synthetase (NDP forming)
VAIIGGGGGPSVLASDEMEGAGLTVPPLSPDVQTKLRQYLPLAGSIFRNPIDAANLVSPEAIIGTMRVLGDVPEINILLYHLGFHPISRWGQGRVDSISGLANVFVEARRLTGKPVLLVLCPPPDLHGMKEFLTVQEGLVKAGLPVFHSIGQTARAMARLITWTHA